MEADAAEAMMLQQMQGQFQAASDQILGKRMPHMH